MTTLSAMRRFPEYVGDAALLASLLITIWSVLEFMG